MTPAKGLRLLKIKQKTTDDKVCAALSNLNGNLDAQAHEKYYHDTCMLSAERTCKDDEKQICDKILKQMCDSEIVLYVQECLKHESEMLTMNHLNKMYISALKEKGLDVDESRNFKKRIKDLLQKSVPFIEFITPDRKNESQYVTSKKVVSSIVDSSAKSNDDSYEMCTLGKIFRHEALRPEFRKWVFTGDFSTWKNPPVFEFVMKQAMFDGKFEQLSEKRKAEAQKSLDHVCQVYVQNVLSDRQVRFDGKGTFNHNIETPLSVGMPLCVHSRSRDYNLVKTLSDAYVGVDYRKLIDLEKRIEYAVLDRCRKTGYLCIPDFVKKGVNLWFVIDNLDFLEATAYGQYTLHGCLIVLFQRDEEGELINPPLEIPSKLPKDPHKFTIQYKPEPEITLVPIKYAHYQHDFGPATDANKYLKFTETWALSSIVGNEKFAYVPESLSKVVPSENIPRPVSHQTPEDKEDNDEPNQAHLMKITMMNQINLQKMKITMKKFSIMLMKTMNLI